MQLVADIPLDATVPSWQAVVPQPAPLADLIAGAAGIYRADEVRLVEVDGWFSNKWLGFTGKQLGAFGVHTKALHVPPIHPNRVLRELAFVRQNETWCRVSRPTLHIQQASEQNFRKDCMLNRTVANGTVIFWLGVSCEDHRRVSLMTYAITNHLPIGWYIALLDSRLDDLLGISVGELSLLSPSIASTR